MMGRERVGSLLLLEGFPLEHQAVWSFVLIVRIDAPGERLLRAFQILGPFFHHWDSMHNFFRCGRES